MIQFTTQLKISQLVPSLSLLLKGIRRSCLTFLQQRLTSLNVMERFCLNFSGYKNFCITEHYLGWLNCCLEVPPLTSSPEVKVFVKLSFLSCWLISYSESFLILFARPSGSPDRLWFDRSCQWVLTIPLCKGSDSTQTINTRNGKLATFMQHMAILTKPPLGIKVSMGKKKQSIYELPYQAVPRSPILTLEAEDRLPDVIKTFMWIIVQHFSWDERKLLHHSWHLLGCNHFRNLLGQVS